MSWNSLWSEEVSTAEKTRENAKKYAKRSMMPDDAMRRAKTMRNSATRELRRQTKS